MGPAAFGQQITVYSSGTLSIGQTRQLTAYVPLVVNTVNWSVNGVIGGNSTYGTVSTTGLYKAPATVPASNAVSVRATSTADATKFGTVTMTVTQPEPQLWSISPTSAALGAFTIVLNGSNFAANSVVKFGGVPLATTLLSATGLRASGTSTAAQVGTQIPITVTNTGLGEVTSPAVNLRITAAATPVTVTVMPASATVAASGIRQFSATVGGSTNTGVVWRVNDVVGGSAGIGTISTTGLYTAPASVPNPAGVVIRATSLADGSARGAATVTIQAAAPAQVTVTVTPSTATVTTSAPRQFTAAIAGSTNTGVTWSVNGMPGGNSSLGTISAAGLYTAPASVPSPAGVTIRATSAADGSAGGNASVTVQAPAPAPVTVAVTPSTATVAPSATQQFSASITGSANTGVTWSVNGVTGGNATVGTISTAGLYAAPAAAPNPASITIRATSAASPSSGATATVNVVGPPNPGTGQGTPNLTAARFLEQAAFGPTPAELAHVKQVGIDAWLTEQFNTPETQITVPSSSGNSAVQQQYLARLSQAPDQLRQRVAYALSQIIPISMNKNNYPDQIIPYLQILSRNAFGNYRTLLGEVSISSPMGKYLDLARSIKPGPGGGANENFAREVTQLFSIGLYMLNPDGSQQLDAQGRPIRAYDETTVQQIALAVTGWTYLNNAWEDFTVPLQPREVNHDTRQKTFLGCTLPANQTTTQDMNGTMDCLFNHPNVGPFITTRLIRSLVTSNPSPAYIQRVAAVFNNNGASVRGDLRAVVKAILTDPEARNDAALPTSGRLKDPIFHIVSFVRTLNGSISQNNGLAWMFSRVGQTPLMPPSVFSFFSPMYHIPQSPLFGPEFQIYTPTESVLRGNFLWSIITQPGGDFSNNLTPFVSVAANTPQLIDAVDQALLYGRMPQQMRQSLAVAIAAQSDNTNRMQTALYLTALSGFFAVQY
jgi:uncharacterized protein (DUF1800 family)